MSDTVILGVFNLIPFFVLMIILVINERNRREDQRESKALMERIDGSSERIAEAYATYC